MVQPRMGRTTITCYMGTNLAVTKTQILPGSTHLKYLSQPLHRQRVEGWESGLEAPRFTRVGVWWELQAGEMGKFWR